jgi:mannose-1-phosphate guanylyltransferase
VLPANFQWSDIGTWNAVFELLDKDEKNNALKGKQIFTRNTKDSLVHIASDKLVALNKVDNLIVVDTGEALLIADRNEEQEIRQVVNEIKALYGERYT